MSLKTRNKIRSEFNMSSLTDIVFLLLIFFMLTSTLVSPNALKLLLPHSESQTLAQQTIPVSITEDLDYYVGTEKLPFHQIERELKKKIALEEDPTVVLNAERSVPVDHVVRVMNICNKLNVKMILATTPKK